MEFKGRYNNIVALTSVADSDPNSDPPDPPDPRVFGPPVSGSINQSYGSGSFYHAKQNQAKIVRKTLISTVL
jgi:hypothetical protein